MIIMNNSPKGRVNYHILLKKGDYPVIPIYDSDVNCKPFCSARITRNIYSCRLVITAIFNNVTQQSFPSHLWQPCQSPSFLLVRVQLSPAETCVSASLMFVLFSSEFTMCYVAPESAINVSLSCSWFDVFAINSSLQIMPSITLFSDHPPPFSSCSNPFLCDFSF